MAAGARRLAGLSAGSSTRPCMAGALAGVLAAGHSSAAWFSTGDSLDMTSQVLPLFMASVAGLDGEGGAGRALLFTVAVVGDGMVASMGSAADPGTFGRSHPTRHWGKDHCCATTTGELVETDIGTLWAFSTVTWFLASVESTGEKLPTSEGARVF